MIISCTTIGSKTEAFGNNFERVLKGPMNLVRTDSCVSCLILFSSIAGILLFTLHSTPIMATTGTSYEIAVNPVCMTFEDYYASFSADSHPSLSVQPATGRMDRRGGEPTILEIGCTPNGASGMLTGDLVINLPEDNSKICYKININSM